MKCKLAKFDLPFRVRASRFRGGVTKTSKNVVLYQREGYTSVHGKGLNYYARADKLRNLKREDETLRWTNRIITVRD